MFRVKFLDLPERTSEVFEYMHLMDALKVAKDTQFSDRLHCPAMSDELFDNELGNLITSGFVYAGKKTSEFPDGELMIMLHRVNSYGEEMPVCPALAMPNAFLNGFPQQKTPDNHVSGAPIIPVDERRSSD